MLKYSDVETKCLPRGRLYFLLHEVGAIDPTALEMIGHQSLQNATQHGVKGDVPHRAEAFAAMQYEDAGKRQHTISRPVSTRRKVKQTGSPEPPAEQPDTQTETTNQHCQTSGAERRAAARKH